MREIKFRGKTIANFPDNKYSVVIPKGKWIHGGITYDEDRVWIDTEYYGQIIVDKETVGQYTGLHDKNGKEIYEGDILQVKGFSYKGYNTGTIKQNVVVEFKDYHWSCGAKSLLNLSTWKEIALEVIGNIYDNPELLKEE